MEEIIQKKDFEGLNIRIEELTQEQRKTRAEIIEKIDKSTSSIIAAYFSESKKIRREIGNQTLILKLLEDNLNDVQLDVDTGISSKIEISAGVEIFGTGAKWILDIDTAKTSYMDILKAIENAPEAFKGKKEWVKRKIQSIQTPN